MRKKDKVIEITGASGTPGSGRYIVVTVSLTGQRIEDLTFETNGCPAATAAACGLTTFLKGREVSQALSLEPRDLLLLIGGLPEGKGYYAAMAVEALRKALNHPAIQQHHGSLHFANEATTGTVSHG